MRVEVNEQEIMVYRLKLIHTHNTTTEKDVNPFELRFKRM